MDPPRQMRRARTTQQVANPKQNKAEAEPSSMKCTPPSNYTFGQMENE
jgi:hypothetical protein